MGGVAGASQANRPPGSKNVGLILTKANLLLVSRRALLRGALRLQEFLHSGMTNHCNTLFLGSAEQFRVQIEAPFFPF